jgi:hypothetical protein
VTVTSTLVLVSLLSACFSAVVLFAVLKGWRDPTWTLPMQLAGFLCSGSCLLIAVAAFAAVAYRVIRRSS